MVYTKGPLPLQRGLFKKESMSKIRITKNCQDKETKENFKKGQVIDHDRAEEIVNKGYAEYVEALKEIPVKSEEVKFTKEDAPEPKEVVTKSDKPKARKKKAKK